MIPILWLSQDDGRGRYNCTAMLNDMLDKYDCAHHPALRVDHVNWNGAEPDGAVLIVHGGRQIGSIDRVNMILDDLRWAVVIVLGDEENTFPVEQLQHPNMKIWIQEPMPGRHEFCDRFILDGWTPHTHKNIVKCDRDLDWMFAGQVTHRRRWECVYALERMDWGGVEIRTRGYCQGVSVEEYYRLLCRAHVVPCPSGPFAPDAARPWEALECGAVPILDDLSPTRKEPGFWKMVLGPDHPLPVTERWDILPRLISEIKSDWTAINEKCQKWWETYKQDFVTWLGKDITELNGK